MRLFVSGATTTIETLIQDPGLRPYLGALVTPNSANSLARVAGWEIPWAIDNAAFDHRRFSPAAFVDLCRRAADCAVPPLFVTVPDQVGNHECTAYLFERWARHLIGLGLWGRLPWAFVAQDGLEDPDDVPWDDIDCLFVGGSDEYKEHDVWTDIVPAAQERKKHVHVGRVNGMRRLRLCMSGDADSVDGSSLSRFPMTHIPRFIEAIGDIEQLLLQQDLTCLDLRMEIVRVSV